MKVSSDLSGCLPQVLSHGGVVLSGSWMGRGVVRQLSEEIAECYRRAGEARDRANELRDPACRQDLLDMERRWIVLAHGYELTERISRGSLTDEMKR
jgi:hypothetical protein